MRLSVLLLGAFVLFVAVPSALAQDTRIGVNFAGLFPLSGVFAKTGAEIEAVARAGIEFFINGDRETFPRLRIIYQPRDTESSPIGGVRAFQERVDSVGSYIGPFLSEVAEFVGTTSAIYEYAVLSYAATKASLSDDERFPFFNRVVPPEDRQGEAIAALIDFYSWHPFAAVLYTSDEVHSSPLPPPASAYLFVLWPSLWISPPAPASARLHLCQPLLSIPWPPPMLTASSTVCRSLSALRRRQRIETSPS